MGGADGEGVTTWHGLRQMVVDAERNERRERAQRALRSNERRAFERKSEKRADGAAFAKVIMDSRATMKQSDLEEHGPCRPAEELTQHNSSAGNRCPDLLEKVNLQHTKSKKNQHA